MSSRTYHDPLHHGISLDATKPAEAMVLSWYKPDKHLHLPTAAAGATLLI